MIEVWTNYIPVIFLIAVSNLLILILFLASYFLGSGTTVSDFEKFSTYECGFEPFADTQGTFDVKFYLLAMLFMVFDLEIMFIVPWITTFEAATPLSVVIFIWFTVLLIVLFVYEWLKGALDWA